ncbi:Serine/threonine-protein kinase Sgk1 [Schistosoma japonicum]|nr:Serine/threonine-protein kinase Sgk1 [Schistosoma japonicum]
MNLTVESLGSRKEYLAPEILRKQPYDFAVDWWCLGCVIYEMLHGLPPFYSENRAHMYRYILERPLKTRNTLSSPTQNILFRLLQKDKINRLGSKSDFEEISRHRFFRDIDWVKLSERKLIAPFLPPVTSSADTRNISPEFVNSAVPNSVICSVIRARNLHGIDETFSGFSYVPTNSTYTSP